MSRIAVSGAMAAAALLATAAPGREPIAPVSNVFVIDPVGPAPAATITVKRGKPLLKLEMRAPQAVRLDGDVDPASAAAAAVSDKFPLTAGRVLFGLEERAGTYCAPLTSRGLGSAGPCLVDADNDGRFEAILKAGFTSNGASAILLSSTGRAFGVNFGKPVLLPAPIAYSVQPYGAAQAAPVALLWQPAGKKNAEGRRPQLAFWFDASAEFTGTGVLSVSTVVDFDGTPKTVEVGGVTLELLGFDAEGALQARIVALRPAQKVAFGFQGAAGIFFVYY